jgi:hypothetical protein
MSGYLEICMRDAALDQTWMWLRERKICIVSIVSRGSARYCRISVRRNKIGGHVSPWEKNWISMAWARFHALYRFGLDIIISAAKNWILNMAERDHTGVQREWTSGSGKRSRLILEGSFKFILCRTDVLPS